MLGSPPGKLMADTISCHVTGNYPQFSATELSDVYGYPARSATKNRNTAQNTVLSLQGPLTKKKQKTRKAVDSSHTLHQPTQSPGWHLQCILSCVGMQQYIYVYIYNICIYIYINGTIYTAWNQQVGQRSQRSIEHVCERRIEKQRLRHYWPLGDARQKARVQGFGAQKGIILSVATKEHPHTPFLFVARNCCITSQKEERKQLRPLGSATWVISNPTQTCQTGFSTEQEVCGFHRNISMPKPRTSAWLSILSNGFAHRSSVKHEFYTQT